MKHYGFQDHRISRSSELWFVKSFLRREDILFPTNEETENTDYTLQEEMVLTARRKGTIIGSVDVVKNRLEQLAKELVVNEFTIVTITAEFEDRLKSYQLLSEAFNLK